VVSFRLLVLGHDENQGAHDAYQKELNKVLVRSAAKNQVCTRATCVPAHSTMRQHTCAQVSVCEVLLDEGAEVDGRVVEVGTLLSLLGHSLRVSASVCEVL
jgi:hypothetical protein